MVNAGPPFRLRASDTAAESTYAGIVRLVTEAENSQAPFVRLADRYAMWFLPLTLAVAGVAWALAGADRAVAVLVVATPCPLILAAPVALVSGLSAAARRGVVVKSGGVLERLAQCTTLVLDKTGTLTVGQPELAAVIPAGTCDLGTDEILTLAGSLDQVSGHVLAAAIVRAAACRGGGLGQPAGVTEVPGQGIAGTVGGRTVRLGRARLAGAQETAPWVRAARRRARLDGALTVFVSIDGEPAGVLLLQDQIRPDARQTIRAVRRGGIRRIVLATGDRPEAAGVVGALTGVDEVLAGLTPAAKLDVVRREQRLAPVIMTGDGINDAPALALADVGIAMGARGATASSEAADAVLTVDQIGRLGEAAALARRTRRIALQSVLAGMGMSLAAMAAAAAGLLPAVWGALLQEAIDVAVILNALRALALPASRSPAAGRRHRPHHAVPRRARGHPGGHRRVADSGGDPRRTRRDDTGPPRPQAARQRSLAARACRGVRPLPGAEPGARRDRPDRPDEQGARRDRRPDRPARTAHRRHRRPGPGRGGHRGPARRPVRPACHPAPAHGAGGRDLPVARRHPRPRPHSRPAA